MTMDPWLSNHYAGTGDDDGPHKIRRGGDTAPPRHTPAPPPRSAQAPPVRVKKQPKPNADREVRTRPWAWFALGFFAAMVCVMYLVKIGVLIAPLATP